MFIKKIKAWKIKNSRNESTIEIMVKTDSEKAYASAPSGASTGKNEVIAFPKEVDETVDFVNKTLREDLYDFEISTFEDFKKLEEKLKTYDSTKNLSKIGGNVIIALEFAILKCLSYHKVWKFINKDAKQIPRPLGNCIGGGAHIKSENKPEFQEFLLLSLNAFNFIEAVDANYKIWEKVGKLLNKPKKTDEGAWSPELSNEKILDALTLITKEVSQEFGFDVRIGLDVAASNFFDGKNYIYKNKKLNPQQQIDYILQLVNKYNLVYIEDPLEENDFKGFAKLTKALSHKCLVCGDDLICTNPERLKQAIKNKSISATIVKPNQIGSIIKTKEVIDLAKKSNIIPIISHRSGETKDTTISQLAVGFNIPIIKCGIYGKEREIKLDEIKSIERQIKST